MRVLIVFGLVVLLTSCKTVVIREDGEAQIARNKELAAKQPDTPEGRETKRALLDSNRVIKNKTDDQKATAAAKDKAEAKAEKVEEQNKDLTADAARWQLIKLIAIGAAVVAGLFLCWKGYGAIRARFLP